ncbi:MAG: response regulator [Nitrospirae bacterium]|nr:response regulator [Nitrospirota bacterium]
MNEQVRILVVDDEESIRGILNETLSMLGYEIIEASSAEEALKELKAHRFDLVMSDIRMAGLSGIQLLERIKGLGLDPEVIIMTSNASLETALEAIRLGAYDYLLKPFEALDYIATVVNRAVERRRLASENRRLLSGLKDKNEELVKAAQRAALILAESHAHRGLLERMLQARDPAEAAMRIAEGTARLFRTRAAGLWLLDPQDRRLKPAGRHGLGSEQMIPIQLPFSEGSDLKKELGRWMAQGHHREVLEGVRKLWGGKPIFDRPLCIGGEGVGLAVWSEPDPSASASHDAGSSELFFLVAVQTLRSLALATSDSAAQSMPATSEIQTEEQRLADPVTQFYNFDFFQELLAIEINRSRRYRHRFTLLMISLIIPNHPDAKQQMRPLLLEMALQMRSRIRCTDLTTRYAQKFFLLMPETKIEEARAVERALENLLKSYREDHRSDPMRSKLLWSIALVEYPKGADTVEGLITSLETLAGQSSGKTT